MLMGVIMAEKKYVVSNDGVFVKTEDILLRVPTQEDMDGMFEVDRLENHHDHVEFESETGRKWWKDLYFKSYTDMERADFFLSIIDWKNDFFLGRLIIQGYNTAAPEIGMYLLEEYQDKGIAPKVINAYMNKARELRDISYFSVRIEDENEYSQKMMRKLNSEELMMIQNTHCYKVY